jgi:geranylgeranyl diphosphate synthase type II
MGGPMAPPAPVDAAAYLDRAHADVDAYLRSILPAPGTGPARLHEAMSYSVFAGGKRLRPALAFAAAESVGGRRSDAVPFAGALELVHTYSLVHDDLPCMDDDDLRRGKPTSHKVFGEATAILAGDALHSLAFESLLHRVEEPTLCRALAHTLARAAGVHGMVGGQVEDLASEGTPPTEAALARIHAAKTAALIAAACEGGGRAGGGTAAQRQALRAYGTELGLAFQVVDDVLDETGTAESLGKTPGKDRRGKKATYVRLEGVEAARARARRHADAAIGATRALPHPETLVAIARYVVSRDR